MRKISLTELNLYFFMHFWKYFFFHRMIEHWNLNIFFKILFYSALLSIIYILIFYIFIKFHSKRKVLLKKKRIFIDINNIDINNWIRIRYIFFGWLIICVLYYFVIIWIKNKQNRWMNYFKKINKNNRLVVKNKRNKKIEKISEKFFNFKNSSNSEIICIILRNLNF